MSVHQVEITTWYLEQRDPGELRPAAVPETAVEIVRTGRPCPEFSRFLYTAVGGDWYWTDRLGWSYEQWRNWLDRPGAETWVAYTEGIPAGFIELDPQPDHQVEIAYFGVLPGFVGHGLGGHLLATGTARAWDLADRWPERKPTERIWVRTCSQDGPAALANYQARGFRLYDTRTDLQPASLRPPGPWPGAR